MFARVSTYKTSPGTTGEPAEETVRRVLELPGCVGLYYLKGKDDKSLSITLWNTQETLVESQQPAGRIRDESSREQNMQILDVEEFEVLTQHLKE
jgi:heme-degrading monooxygenase HmoA